MAGEAARILFVDDEPALADGHAAQLTEDYDVETAYDGDEALAVVDDGVDVVFLDRRMPGRSGGEVLEEIRDRELDCRVVMLTGVEPDVDVVEMGYDEYVVKPIDEDVLRDTVDRMLEPGPIVVDAEILDALGDPKTRRCCSALVTDRVSAKELADETGYSLTTVYRRLNSLQQAGIVEAHDTVDRDGDHYKTFTAVSTSISIEIDDALQVDVERAGGQQV